MATFPPDVLVIEPRGILYLRFQRAGETDLTAISRVPLEKSVFRYGPISPAIADPAPLVEALGRIATNRRIDEVSVLLPDSWFKLHVLALDSLPDRRSDADEIVRWSLRRNLPGRTEELRMAWHTIERRGKGGRVAVLAAAEETISRLEKAIETAGMNAVVVEPIGLSLWNALTSSVPVDGEERLLMLAREDDLALVLFRGDKPLFYRSKRLVPQTDLTQEIRLSASYLKTQVGVGSLALCWVAGERIGAGLHDLIRTELDTPVHAVSLEDAGIRPGAIDVRGEEIAVAAAMGVFAA